MSNFPSKKGRPIGSKNRSSEIVRNSFKLLIENNLERLQKDLDKMSEIDRVKCLIALSRFVLPQLNSVDLTTQVESSFTPVQIIFENEN